MPVNGVKKAGCLLGAALFAAAFGASATTAHATTSIGCTSADGGNVSVDIGTGTLPILNVLSATISADGQVWSTDGSLGTEISFGQGFSDGRQLLIDFTDPNIEEILVSVRIFQSFEGKSGAQAGVLVFPGLASYSIVCES